MMSHVGTCQHILAHVGMSTCADTYWNADHVQMIGIMGAESDVTCRHMSACPYVLTNASMQIISKWLASQMPRVMLHVGTYRHMSAHISTCRHMSTCADTCQLGGKVQMLGIRDAESDATCRHMSAHITTCRHVQMC